MAQDFTAAREWYEETLAHEDGARTRLNLASLCLNGLGVNPSPATARAHIQEAAAINQEGFTAAMDEYEMEADQGDDNAQHLMGCIFHHGLGVARNVVRAGEWYGKAAQQGHGGAKEALEGLGIAATAEGQSSNLNTTTALLPEAEEPVEISLCTAAKFSGKIEAMLADLDRFWPDYTSTWAQFTEPVGTGDDDDDWLQGHSSVTSGEAASRPITKAKTKKVKQSKKGGKKKKK